MFTYLFLPAATLKTFSTVSPHCRGMSRHFPRQKLFLGTLSACQSKVNADFVSPFEKLSVKLAKLQPSCPPRPVWRFVYYDECCVLLDEKFIEFWRIFKEELGRIVFNGRFKGTVFCLFVYTGFLLSCVLWRYQLGLPVFFFFQKISEHFSKNLQVRVLLNFVVSWLAECLYIFFLLLNYIIVFFKVFYHGVCQFTYILSLLF